MDGESQQSLDALLEQAPSVTQNREIKCCCGSPQCAFLKHNTAALEGLEKDLVSAAQIGQALLIRHETHMVEAEQERIRLSSSMEQLESDKKALEESNAKTIQENRNLLDQLEGLNNLVSESDVHIQALTATLQSTQQELQRLTILAGRTATLEQQLTNLETEQAQLQSQLRSSHEEERSAIQRWKRAEGTIGHLQEQIDRIEKEAKEERERHVEVLGRLERRRTVERELENAAGRLKGAAAVNSMGKYNNDGSNVVSHFVKDILQDNANLQMGIVELREMLMGSNAEVENLRHQLQLHQPLEEDDRPTLNAELSHAEAEVHQPPLEAAPELHVHHHYHGPEITIKKPRRKRPSLTSTHFPTSGTSTPRAQQRIKDWRSATPSSSATILSQTSVTVPPVRVRPQGHQHRWSTQTTSSFAPSSVPSSPQHASSIFDNIEGAFEFSRPTTPESSAPGSPTEAAKDVNHGRKLAYRSVSTPNQTHTSTIAESSEPSTVRQSPNDRFGDFDDPTFSEGSLPPPTPLRLNSTNDNTHSVGPEPIPEECEGEELISSASETASYLEELNRDSRPLRRAASHESLLSVSGMDIHTLRSRPSQLLVTGMGFSPRPSLSPASAALKSTQPVFSTDNAFATPSLTRGNMDSGSYTRSLLTPQRHGISHNDMLPTGTKQNLTRRVGGWVWSKWGVAPSPSVENLREKTAFDSFVGSPMRRPGVNQSGPIQGLRPPPKTPIQVVPKSVDENALGEALAETVLD